MHHQCTKRKPIAEGMPLECNASKIFSFSILDYQSVVVTQTTKTEEKMAYIQERKTEDGKVHYRVQVRLKGFPTTCATFERKTDAKLWVQQTEAAMREGRHFKTTEAKKHTLADLIDRYIEQILPSKPKNAAATKAHLLWWKKQMGHCLLADLTPALIAEQRDILLKGITFKGSIRSPSTCVRYLSSLSTSISYGRNELGWLEDSPMQKVRKPKEPRGRTRFLDDDERARLLAACKESTNPYLYIVFVIAISTGLRLGELMTLRWESNIDLFNERIILHETKNGERRVVPLRGHALDLLKIYSSKNKRNFGLLLGER